MAKMYIAIFALAAFAVIQVAGQRRFGTKSIWDCEDSTGQVRLAGESYKCRDDCNTCSCGYNGQEKSTQKKCIATRIPAAPPRVCKDNKGKVRQAGESYKCRDDCNSCTCIGNGWESQTQMTCSVHYGLISDPANGQWGAWAPWSNCPVTCGGGSRVRTRACTNPAPSNGGQSCPGLDREAETCSAKICRATRIPAAKPRVCKDNKGKVRQAGESYKCRDDCNSCTCIGNGMESQTQMACMSIPWDCKDNTGISRFAGEKYKCRDNCNTCTCGTDGKEIRTRMACMAAPVLKRFWSCKDNNGNVRKAGESYTCPDKCNTCTCQSNGMQTSTRIACIKAPTPKGVWDCKDSTGKIRQAGETYKCRDNCSYCKCGYNGQERSTQNKCNGPPVASTLKTWIG